MGKVSVIVPAWNAESRLRKCLNSIFRMDYAEFEVIVVDDCSNDATVARAREFPIILVKNKKNMGAAISRNIGVGKASGDYLAFIDCDCFVSKNWVNVLLNNLKEYSEVALVGSQVTDVTTRNNYLNKYVSIGKFPYYEKRGQQFVDFLPSVGWLLKREAFQKCGGFNEKFTTGGEDVEFCDRLRKHGYRIVYDTRATLYHDHPMTLKRFVRRHYENGVNYVTIMRTRETLNILTILVYPVGWFFIFKMRALRATIILRDFLGFPIYLGLAVMQGLCNVLGVIKGLKTSF